MRWFAFVSCLLLAGGPAVASAAAPDDSDYLEARRERHRQLRERVEARLEVLRTEELTRALQLPEADIRALAAEMKRFDERRQAIRAPLREARWTVKAAAQGDAAAAAKVEAALAAATEARKRLADLDLEEYRALVRMVPADRRPQLARFLLQFPHEVQRIIHEARGRGAGRGFPGGPGPGGFEPGAGPRLRDGMGPPPPPRDGMGPRGDLGPWDDDHLPGFPPGPAGGAGPRAAAEP
jgi:hypothetical protein